MQEHQVAAGTPVAPAATPFQSPFRREPILRHEDRLPPPPHVRNFLNSVKTREEPNAPVEVGHSAVCAPHLANIAYHIRRTTYLNPSAAAAY